MSRKKKEKFILKKGKEIGALFEYLKYIGAA